MRKKTTIPATSKATDEKDELDALLTITPEHTAMIVLTNSGIGPTSTPKGRTRLLEAILEKTKAVSRGNSRYMERMLCSQAIALDSIFSKWIGQLASAQFIDQAEVYATLAFKAQNQCRNTLETLARVKGLGATTFIRQQNNAVNQQINNSEQTALPQRNKLRANELLDDKNDSMDKTATITPITTDLQMGTMEKINRRKIKQREK